jgi:uncharacterized protein YjeT (DUF2065 family)
LARLAIALVLLLLLHGLLPLLHGYIWGRC